MLMEGRHTETEEDMVVYEGQDGRIWLRPKYMFYENLEDGTPRFRPCRDPSEPRWRCIPGWTDSEGRGWQLSDCGKLRDTGAGEEEYNDFDEVVGIVFDEFVPEDIMNIHLYGHYDDGWKEATVTFSALKKAIAEGQPPEVKRWC